MDQTARITLTVRAARRALTHRRKAPLSWAHLSREERRAFRAPYRDRAFRRASTEALGSVSGIDAELRELEDRIGAKSDGLPVLLVYGEKSPTVKEGFPKRFEAAKYANASRVIVRLTASDGSLSLAIEDDGDGFNLGSTRYGTGPQGMADRLDSIGGTPEVRSEPGAGTAVMGQIPLHG